jgi:uroporphyrinogen decarboxylase
VDSIGNGQVIEIGISVGEIERRKNRIEATLAFQKPDRVPVRSGRDEWYFLKRVGYTLPRFFSSAKDMLEGKLLAEKWFFENVKTDDYEIGVGPNFQNAPYHSALGCEVIFTEGDFGMPWVKPWLRDRSDLKTLRQMDVINGGLNGKAIEYREWMIEHAEDYPVRFGDGEIFYPAKEPGFAGGSHGPVSDAVDLMGAEAFYVALYDSPDFVKELLDILTDKCIEHQRWMREKSATPIDGVGLADDSAGSLSVDQFCEFSLPYLERIRDTFPGHFRFHMCGVTDHLLKVFRDELRIDSFWAFCAKNNRALTAEILSGKVHLYGNIEPSDLFQYSKEKITAECKDAIDHFAKGLGYVLFSGVPAEAPLENLNAVYEAAERYGRY